MSEKKIIEIKNLKKIYKVKDVVANLKGQRQIAGITDANFEVEEGVITSVIGLNGAGKTTVMKCILGLIKHDEGEVKVFGKAKLERQDYYNIGYLPEISYYPKEVKLRQLISYYAELNNMNFKKNIDKFWDLLTKLELERKLDERLYKFSKGMLQRVGLFQAIMCNPKLLFLDEPMSGLDPLGRRIVMEIIKGMEALGTTIILNTHILSDVEKLGGKVIIIDQAKVKKIINVKEIGKELTLEEYFLKEIGVS